MKRLSVVLLFTVIIWTTFLAPGQPAYGLTGGAGFLYSGEDVWTLFLDFDGWIAGIFGKNWTDAEERETGTSNYGQTKVGEIDEIVGFDVGYTWRAIKHLRLGIEGSAGIETHYSKYKDNRFTEDYYLHEESSDWVFGVGAVAVIPIDEVEMWNIVFSVNTVKGVSGGISIKF